MKKIVSILLAVMLMLSLSVAAFAADDPEPTPAPDGKVLYKGGAEKFVYFPATDEFTDTDMFNDGFKNVMPGDVVYGKVGIGNIKNSSKSYIIYMRAIAHDENHPDYAELEHGNKDARYQDETYESNAQFLSMLNLEIKNGDKVIFNDAPCNTGDLENWISLGRFKKGEGTILDLTLTVPVELDNTFANRIGEVDWQFMVVEVVNPDTGDDSSLAPYVMLCGLSAAAMGAALVLKKKYN